MLAKKESLTALCLVFCLMAVSMPKAMAAQPPTGGESEIVPMMEYIL